MPFHPSSYFSTHNGAQWCYVEKNIGYGYSTCTDQIQSARFEGETWSYHACTTSALTQYSCRHCQGIRNSPRKNGYGYIPGNTVILQNERRQNVTKGKKPGIDVPRKFLPRRPIIKKADPVKEGLGFGYNRTLDNDKIVF